MAYTRPSPEAECKENKFLEMDLSSGLGRLETDLPRAASQPGYGCYITKPDGGGGVRPSGQLNYQEGRRQQPSDKFQAAA